MKFFLVRFCIKSKHCILKTHNIEPRKWKIIKGSFSQKKTERRFCSTDRIRAPSSDAELRADSPNYTIIQIPQYINVKV